MNGERLAGFFHAAQHLVVMSRVVVRQGEQLDARPLGHLAGLLPTAVAPAAMLLEFLRRVLGVVDQQVGAACQVDDPLVDDAVHVFDVGAVGDDFSILPLDPVGVGPAGMIVEDAEHMGLMPRRRRLRCPDLGHVVLVEGVDGGVLEGERRSHLIQWDREIHIFHLPGEHRLQAALKAIESHGGDHEVPGGIVGRREERKPLDVVPVEVGKQHEDRAAEPFFGARHHLLAQLPDAGACVEDPDPVRSVNQDAGRVAAEVLKSGFAHGRRAAGAVELDIHGAGPGPTATAVLQQWERTLRVTPRQCNAGGRLD